MYVSHTLIGKITQEIDKAARCAFSDLPAEFTPEVAEATQEAFGHYQCNSAMKLARDLKKNPRQIAQAICDNIGTKDIIQKVEVAGPGFINITLGAHAIVQELERLLFLPHLGISAPEKQKIIVDFSSPNTAKEMHVGHLRSTIIGDCLCRVFEFLGHDVLRLNHIGDWGTAFGMLIAYLKFQTKDSVIAIQKAELVYLMQCYKQAKKLFDEDPIFKKQSQQEVVALQSGQEEALKIWEAICGVSRKAYQEIYDLLGIKIIERGESFYNPYLADVVQDLEQKGLITISDGAKCLFLEGFVGREGELLPLMLQKSDGGYNYDTTDMAAIRHRCRDENAGQIIYITDAGQSLHFQMVFAAAIKAGYLDPHKVRVCHVPFGLVLGPDGKKFRTRAGDTERLVDLLVAAQKKAKEILIERNPEWSDEEREMTAKALGLGAVKYSDLACHRVGDYVFSYERMLKFEGNTAAFVMYSYVRVLGIQKKVGWIAPPVLEKGALCLNHLSEVALGLHLARFPEILDQVIDELLPNRLTEYLYTLAEKFNAFFRDCRVEGSQEEHSRLLLVEATRRVLKEGLELLGLQVVERM